MIEILRPLSRAWRAWRGARRARLETLAARPLPVAWRGVLEVSCPHYRRMPPDYQRVFEQQLQIFLADKRVTGVEIELTDDLRVLVAASAVCLSAGWPFFTWDLVSEVLVYPSEFDHDYAFERGDLSGQAHPWGMVLLSAPALRRHFARPDEWHHVGFHEFAHVLDLSRGSFDGVPSFLGARATEDWLRLAARERERIHRGDSVVDPYALTGEVEFFPTAVEAFMQRPEALAAGHPELYGFLAEYFRQDPAAWSRRTGSGGVEPPAMTTTPG